MNLRSCCTGSISQRRDHFRVRTDLARSTETIKSLEIRNRLRHLLPRLTIKTSPGNNATIRAISSSRKVLVRRRMSMGPN
jgi:hypothetical protein